MGILGSIGSGRFRRAIDAVVDGEKEISEASV